MSLKTEAICGCIIGTAIGDALGLPYEGLSPGRAGRLFKPPDRYHFLLNHGMVSDDTEHTCMVAQALIASGGKVNIFTRDFARRLRYWLLSLPGAPDGEYVVIQYATTFENKKSAIETITPMLDGDGKWRVSGYYIK